MAERLFFAPDQPDYVPGEPLPSMPTPSEKIAIDPPMDLEAGVPYVFYIDWTDGEVAVDHVSEPEWSRVKRGELPGEAVRLAKDMTLTEVWK